MSLCLRSRLCLCLILSLPISCQVRLWNIQSSCYSNTRSPSSIRKRIRALPTRIERRKLFVDEPSSSFTNADADAGSPSPAMLVEEARTPESQKKCCFSFEVREYLDTSPETQMTSPSSVLNPPSSLKRKTIRDYFPVSWFKSLMLLVHYIELLYNCIICIF